MLLVSSMVGMRPPIQAAQPESSSYEAKTGQSSAYFSWTRPYTVRTDLPWMKDGEVPLGWEGSETHEEGSLEMLDSCRYWAYWGC